MQLQQYLSKRGYKYKRVRVKIRKASEVNKQSYH